MEKSVLFILGQSQDFLVTSLLQKLDKAGYKTVCCDGNMISLSRVKDMPEICILYIDGYERVTDNVLTYLNFRMLREKMYLYIIGSQEEIKFANRCINPSMIMGTFKKPAKVENIVEELDLLCERGGKVSGEKRLLIVDDDSEQVKVLKKWLSSQYIVYNVDSGIKAISFLKQNEFVDLVLLDYEMPGLSGLETYRILKQSALTNEVPIVFLTAKDDKETVTKILKVHPRKYILKSLPQEELVSSINSIFAAS